MDLRSACHALQDRQAASGNIPVRIETANLSKDRDAKPRSTRWATLSRVASSH